MRKQERDKKAKILKKEFRESCNDVFNRPDEETSWKYMHTITKSSLFPTNCTDSDEKQLSMKIKVQVHSPPTSGQSGIPVLNRYSITN